MKFYRYFEGELSSVSLTESYEFTSTSCVALNINQTVTIAIYESVFNGWSACSMSIVNGGRSEVLQMLGSTLLENGLYSLDTWDTLM